MPLIIVTIVVIASLIAVLAVFLFAIGVLLNRIADNLDDCLGNVKKIAGQADVVIPGVERINQTGQVVTAALPLLVEGAEGITVKLPVTAPRPMLRPWIGRGHKLATKITRMVVTAVETV